MTSPDHLERHKRHILLKEIGGPGIAKLAKAHVSIVGAGALGGPCALYLAAAGCGRITLWDDDTVDLSNLQRQIQFTTAEIGMSKTERLAARLHALNPDITIDQHKCRFGVDTALPPGTDLLVDATDSFESRYALNQSAFDAAIPLVSGAASGWTGQVSVFAPHSRSDAPCYNCWVPEMPPDPADCDAMGVVGALTGWVGAHMALETIKLITGAGTPLIGRIAIYDGLSGALRTVALKHDPCCATCARKNFPLTRGE